MDIVEPNDVKTGRGGGKRGNRYSEYSDALKPHIPFFKEKIAMSKDGKIRIKTGDMANTIRMPNKASSTIYWGTMYALFKEGIKVEGRGQVHDGDEVLILRLKNDRDILPPYLQKVLEEEQGDV